jgi:PAS domain S-box-containing protein
MVLGLRREGAACATRWVLVNVMPLGSPPAGAVATFADVTGYRHDRQAARDSEENCRVLLESLPAGVLQTDVALRLTYCNPAVLALTGYTREEIETPQLLASKVYPRDMPGVCALAGAALAGRPGRGEFRYRAKDGTSKVAQLLVQPRRENGEVAGVTALLVDVPREHIPEHESRESPFAIAPSSVLVPRV